MATNKQRRTGSVRTGSQVGPEYPDAKRINPWDDEMSSQFGEEHDKAICSENSTLFEGGGMPINHNYDGLWEGK